MILTIFAEPVEILAAKLEEYRVYNQWLSDAGAGRVDMRERMINKEGNFLNEECHKTSDNVIVIIITDRMYIYR